MSDPKLELKWEIVKKHLLEHYGLKAPHRPDDLELERLYRKAQKFEEELRDFYNHNPALLQKLEIQNSKRVRVEVVPVPIVYVDVNPLGRE